MKHIFYLLLLSLLALSCAKDEPIIDDRVPAIYPVQSRTVGRVLNTQGTPIADAVVELNGQQRITNSLGLFRFEKMELNGAGTNITVRKLGYFNAFRTFIPNIPTISSVTVYMIDRPTSGSFPHSTGGTISVNGGGTVTILPNSVVTASGATYTGEVVVSAYWIDPTDVNALSVMPGDLRGYSLENELMQLATYGMMVVELSSPSGEPLNIGNGMTATLTFPVGGSLLSSAPGVIPLWSFNETTGYWEEEGSASIEGTNYVAEVTHFSWWNCDAPFPVVEHEVCVLSEDGSPVSGAQVAITITSGNLSGRPLIGIAYTNQDGKAFGKIPKNESLQLEILIGDVIAECGFTEVYSATIGPFSEIGSSSITVDATLNARIVDFSGNFVNCDGDPITDGVVLTSVSDTAFPINGDGTVDFSMISCTDDIEISAYDFEELKQSPSSTFTTTLPVNDITLINFEVCDNLDEYITIAEDGGMTHLYMPPQYISSGDIGHQILHNEGPIGDDLPLLNTILIGWGGFQATPQTGQFTSLIFSATKSGTDFYNGEVEVSVDEFNIPGYVVGSYSGVVNLSSNGTNTTVNVTGTFRVKTQ